MSDRQAHASNAQNGTGSLARSKSLSGKQNGGAPSSSNNTNTNATPAPASASLRRTASQRQPPITRRPSEGAALRPSFQGTGLTSTSELYAAVPAPPPHLRDAGVLPVSPLAAPPASSGETEETEAGPKLIRPQPVAFGGSASGSAVVSTPGQSFYGGSGAGFTAMMGEGSPIQSPYNSQPPSRRGSIAQMSHPHASGPRPPVIRRRDSSASGYGGYELAPGQVYVDVDSATPSMLSRAGSPTLPLMNQRTASRSSSRRGSMADGVRPGFGGGFGGFEMSMLSQRKGGKEEEFVGSIDCGTT